MDTFFATKIKAVLKIFTSKILLHNSGRSELELTLFLTQKLKANFTDFSPLEFCNKIRSTLIFEKIKKHLKEVLIR